MLGGTEDSLRRVPNTSRIVPAPAELAAKGVPTMCGMRRCTAHQQQGWQSCLW